MWALRGSLFLKIGVIATAIVLTSCAGVRNQTPVGSAQAPAVVPPGTTPAAGATATDVNRKLLSQLSPAEDNSDLPLGPGDLIEVSVFDVQELSSLKLRIANSGNITLPLIGTLPAGGLRALEAPAASGVPEQVMTTIDLQSLVAGRQELNLSLQAGDVVEVPRAGSFYVGGEVTRPGSFLLKSHTTLDQASVLAGGVKDGADWDDV